MKPRRPNVVMALLHRAFHQPGSKTAKVIEAFIWVLIVFSCTLVILETTTSGLPNWVYLLDRIVLWVFVAEITIRTISFQPPNAPLATRSRRTRMRRHIFGRLRYLFSGMQLVDLMVILTLVPSLRGFRALRFLRLVRGIHFFKYSHPITSIMRTFRENAIIYLFALAFIFLVVIVGGANFYFIEASHNPNVNSLQDGIWWAVVTLTTVGYGDITPVTAPAGRVLAAILMLLGMFTLALFAGIVSNTLLKVFFNMRKDQLKMFDYTNHTLVCGYSPSVNNLLKSLAAEQREGGEIIVFDEGDRPETLPDEFIWIGGDPTKESELDKVHFANAACAIIVGDRQMSASAADARTVLTIFTLRAYLRHHPDLRHGHSHMHIIAEIFDPENVDHAMSAGADEVVETESLGFSLMAHAASVHGSAAVLTRIVKTETDNLYMKPNPEGKPIAFGALSAKLHQESKEVLLGVKVKHSNKVVINPPDNNIIEPDDEIVFLGDTNARHTRMF